jgi:predicted RNA-binding protein with PIN domain
MAILIDGYNLLNAAGVEGRGRGTALAQARRGLLTFLAAVLSESEAASTTIVFDSKDAPPGLPKEEQFGPIRVLFSKGYRDADELIEELIQADHSPRQLLVVSSDHRLHRAARRRKASAVDSQRWLSDLRRRNAAARHGERGKPAASQPPAAQWLAEFSGIDVEEIQAEVQRENEPKPATTTSAADTPATSPADQLVSSPRSKKRAAHVSPPKDGVDDDLLRAAKGIFPPEFFADSPERTDSDAVNPFPPGYGEDVQEEEGS